MFYEVDRFIVLLAEGRLKPENEQVAHSSASLPFAPEPTEGLGKYGAAVNAVMASFAVNKLVVVAFKLQ